LTLLRRNKRSWEARKLCVRCDPPPRTPLLYRAIRKDLISPSRKSARFYAAEQLYLESERARELSGRLQAAHRLIETYEANACAICRTALRALEGET